MPTIEVTTEQAAFIDQLRSQLSETVVGKYGHVREQDAIQYLIDNFGGELDHEAVGETPPEELDLEVDDSQQDSQTGLSGNGDSGAADDDELLKEMTSLLETYDDVWENADTEEARYVVDLPDGTTANAQTKDDVRALLFKHYR